MIPSPCHSLTIHGFRSAFRDWSAEATGTPREVAEAALAHVVSNRAEAAYSRTDHLEKRRALMDTWGTFVTGGNPADRVIRLAREGGE